MTWKPLAIAATLLFAAGTGNAEEMLSGQRLDLLQPTADRLIEQARLAEVAGQDHKAEALYRRAHRLDPVDARPLTGWGYLANRIGAHDQAVALFHSALSADPSDAAARRGLAVALVELDRPGEALAHFDTLLIDDPEDFRSWNGRGLALDLQNRHSEAQIAYQQGLAVAPGNASLADNLGLSLYLAGRSGEPIPAPYLTMFGDPTAPSSDNRTLAQVEGLALEPLPDRDDLLTIDRLKTGELR